MTRLAGFIDRRCRAIVVVAALVTIAAGAYGLPVVDSLDPYSAADPDSESVETTDRIERAIRFDPDAGLVALVDPSAPIRTERAQAEVEEIANQIFRDRGIGWVETWYETHLPGMVSRDGQTTYIVAHFRPSSDRTRQLTSERLLDRYAGRNDVKLGGFGAGVVQASETARTDLTRAQLIALPLLLLISFWFFRGLVAAMLPVIVGGASIVLTLAALRLATEVTSISIFALNLVTALGLGLALDYSLITLSRYREETAGGAARVDALAHTLSSAGRTVLFSSVTIGFAMAALTIFPQRFLYSMGIGGVIVAVLACAISMLVLPAVLALLGSRIDALAPRALARRRRREARPLRSGGWYRLAQGVMRRPAVVALASALLLVGLAIPALGMKFAAIDADMLPKSTSTRQVDEVLARDFDVDRQAPIQVAINGADRRSAERFADRLQRLEGVREVDGPSRINDQTTLIQIATPDAFADRTEDIVREIRSRSGGLDVAVGGIPGAWVDQQESISSHIPLALAIIALTTFLAVFVMTGSVVIPIKTIIMNALSVGAAFGILVLVFQDGRFESLLGYTGSGALELSQPVLLFALAFGLSTDYGLFMVARIKEAHDGGAPNRDAIAIGLERTGRIVTAAALMFAVAIGTNVTSQLVFVKELALGAAAAVVIDATIVRALLVPSLMALLGRWNWWPGRSRVSEIFRAR